MLMFYYILCTLDPLLPSKRKLWKSLQEAFFKGVYVRRRNTIHFDHNICAVVLLFLVMSWEQLNTLHESFKPGRGVLLVYQPRFPTGVKRAVG